MFLIRLPPGSVVKHVPWEHPVRELSPPSHVTYIVQSSLILGPLPEPLGSKAFF